MTPGRDCSYSNVWMDATTLYPHGFHPSDQDALPSRYRSCKGLSRSPLRPTKYYFGGFGVALHIDGINTPPLIMRDGLNGTIPELLQPESYDPFKLDIFVLGKLYARKLTLVRQQARCYDVIHCSLEISESRLPMPPVRCDGIYGTNFSANSNRMPGYVPTYRVVRPSTYALMADGGPCS